MFLRPVCFFQQRKKREEVEVTRGGLEKRKKLRVVFDSAAWKWSFFWLTVWMLSAGTGGAHPNGQLTAPPVRDGEHPHSEQNFLLEIEWVEERRKEKEMKRTKKLNNYFAVSDLRDSSAPPCARLEIEHKKNRSSAALN